MQVHFMHAVHRTADKVCTPQNRGTFVRLGALAMDENESKENVEIIFRAMGGDMQLADLPPSLKQSLPESADSVDTRRWRDAKSWVQWWTRPIHLSMLFLAGVV